MQVLHQLPVVKDKDLIVGIETADDAGVYKISGDTAVITTLDFFPPIVDDAATFGAIAAANALSDVYAMGGTPRLATNIVCFPKKLPMEVLGDIIRGGMDKLKEAGVLLVGGHSVEDSEVKYGLSITGFVHPERIVTNSGARPGDVLILTKPIGVGVVTGAVKAGKLKPSDVEDVFSSMTALNKRASELMVEVGVNACTDITGYGLMGHAMEMARGSGVTLEINSKEVMVFPHALEFVKKRKIRPRTLEENRDFLLKDMVISGRVDEATGLILFDPQTSGGLLISVDPGRSDTLIERMKRDGITPAVVGRVVQSRVGRLICVE
ncbi:MAG: selenide, water dikinase SelD [Thermodesulfobacteriota bacterium]|nr:MAG: selenide, water dikinase SelD [Thermodesulfobacteriota bacterium]